MPGCSPSAKGVVITIFTLIFYRARIALQVYLERVRAQRLRFQSRGVIVARGARLGRGSHVSVAPGGRLILGPVAIGRNTTIHVGPAGCLSIRGRYIGPGCVVVARDNISVEPGTMIAEMCVIRDSDHERDIDGTISVSSHVSAAVRIGADSWLAANVIVLKGVTVGERVTVAAGAVVTRSVSDGHTVAGVPARVISTEDPRP